MTSITQSPPATAHDLAPLSRELGISVESLSQLDTRPHPDGWATPERDADGERIGTSIRRRDGSKCMIPGSKRGLTYAAPLPAYAGSSPDDPILIVEGASDTAAGLDLGHTAIGRPSATGGRDHLRALLADRYVVIIAENDRKESGDWPGQCGAEIVACGLADVAEAVKIVFPPEESKDLRQWLAAGADRAEVDAAIRAAEPYGPPEVPGADRESAAAGPRIVMAADIEPEPVRWLWPGRIAIGKLTVLAGDPGLGKSFLTLDLASRVSTGAGWPDAPGERCEPGGVVLLSAEDDPADTIIPRLIAAGADRDRIAILEAVPDLDDRGERSERTFNLERDCRHLETAIERTPDCRLVVIDPISAYCGRTDSHKNAETRGLLAPLADLAARHGVAVLAVTHLNKGQGSALHRTMGSVAFVAAARAAWVVARDKEEPSRRLLLPIKNNLGNDQTGLAYALRDAGTGTPQVHWEAEPVETSADDALAPERGTPGPEPTERSEAAEFLREVLRYGPVRTAELKAEAKEAGLSWGTVRRAKTEVGAEVYREGYGAGGGWRWRLTKGAQPTSPPNNLRTFGEPAHLCENEGKNAVSPQVKSTENGDCAKGAQVLGEVSGPERLSSGRPLIRDADRDLGDWLAGGEGL